MVNTQSALKTPLLNSKLVNIDCLAALIPLLSFVPMVDATSNNRAAVSNDRECSDTKRRHKLSSSDGAFRHRRLTKELFYVAASRGRHRITVFTGDKTKLRESIGVSGERMSALELLRKQTRTVDRTRTAERPRTVAQSIGKLLELLWLNIPRLVFGERFAPERQGVEMGGR